MIKDAENGELFAEWYSYIESDNVKEAFCLLIGLAVCSERYKCQIRWKGLVRDFQFYDHGGEQPYSFITNQESLLFYFRKPALRSGHFSRKNLVESFESVEENTAGELKVKIVRFSDARTVARLIDIA